ncbi:MAG TPA: hypothetical protein VGR32_11095 [Brevundimonas sp.]|jgi:hypothetical protein|uniref:hypothetical protein n=1 Tax=Brevundimonas sp. TaxID=1871086 RepID=UPI002DEC98E1|nr:hypothetical protein [Brevundimonas sp.]
MAEKDKPVDLRVFMWVALSDVLLGAGLAAAGHLGWFGPHMELLVPVGGLIALAGVGMAVWAKIKMNAAESRRGDLN